MKTEFELSNANIPYGVLHDQILSDLKYENGELIFTFDIEIFENDNLINEYSYFYNA